MLSAVKAGELADKWQKCLRRIPLRPKSANDNVPIVHVNGDAAQQLLPPTALEKEPVELGLSHIISNILP